MSNYVYTSPSGRYKVYTSPPDKERPILYHIHDTLSDTAYGNRPSLEDAKQDIRAAEISGGFENPAFRDYWSLKTEVGIIKMPTMFYGESHESILSVADPGVRRLLRALWNAGYETYASCSGHKDLGIETGWVRILGPLNREEREDIKQLLAENNYMFRRLIRDTDLTEQELVKVTFDAK